MEKQIKEMLENLGINSEAVIAIGISPGMFGIEDLKNGADILTAISGAHTGIPSVLLLDEEELLAMMGTGVLPFGGASSAFKLGELFGSLIAAKRKSIFKAYVYAGNFGDIQISYMKQDKKIRMDIPGDKCTGTAVEDVHNMFDFCVERGWQVSQVVDFAKRYNAEKNPAGLIAVWDKQGQVVFVQEKEYKDKFCTLLGNICGVKIYLTHDEKFMAGRTIAEAGEAVLYREDLAIHVIRDVVSIFNNKQGRAPKALAVVYGKKVALFKVAQ